MRKTIVLWKTIAVAMIILVVAIAAIVILHETNTQSSSNPPNHPSLTPTPKETQKQFVVATVTASPSNTTPGLVTIIAEVRNDGTKNETVLVIMQIQEPNGVIMSIANNSSLLEIPAGDSKTTTFEPIIPLNVKIGKFNVDIDVYDLNQTTKCYSTDFIHSFTTPIRFRIHIDGFLGYGSFNMTVDGTTYQEQSMTFYWYLGTKHTVSVPDIIMNPGLNTGVKFSDWEGSPYDSEGTTLQLTVTADGPTEIGASYGPYFS